jgi:cyclopropane fatty-acyl-phospholipid synthase-like methyltransferase
MPRAPANTRWDRHRLYERAVQCPEADVRFLRRIFRQHYGRDPRLLREDFCGTAALAAEWVRTHPRNRAWGVDLDPEVLAWGWNHHVVPLGPDMRRIRLLRADVRSVTEPKVDVVVAMNFSYFIFKKRPELVDYFRRVRHSVRRRGLFVVDIFGGWEAQALRTETKRLPGFTYYWQQVRYDPITHETLFHIHFRLRDGRWIRRAFTYDWRLWTIPEVREAMEEAGFRGTEVYWEGTDHATGEGNGVFRRAEKATNCPGWIAYVVGY